MSFCFAPRVINAVQVFRPGVWKSPNSFRATFASFRSGSDDGPSEDEQHLLRGWLSEYGPNTIPRHQCEISFSRSSGPGGQKVNKTSSKATLRLQLQHLRDSFPKPIFNQLRESRYYAERSDSLVIQADSSRSQTENKEDCYAKLDDLVRSIGRNTVRAETSQEQHERVKKLQKAENEGRLRVKKMQSSKKSSRRGRGSSDY